LGRITEINFVVAVTMATGYVAKERNMYWWT